MKRETLKKYFSRDASLMAFQIWHYSETNELYKWIGYKVSSEIFENRNGTVYSYLTEEERNRIFEAIIRKIKKDKNFIKKSVAKYLDLVRNPMVVWRRGKPLKTRRELGRFFNQLVRIWPGITIIYLLPQTDRPEISERDKKICLKARALTDDLFNGSNDIFLKTVSKLNPEISNYAKYISIEELIKNKIPPDNILRKRERCYILFNSKIIINKSLSELAKKHNLKIEKEPGLAGKIIKGIVAKHGKARGIVRVITTKDQFQKVTKGDILVTSMTTPDYVPIMKLAAAIITDEGGVTCHAAIVARELKIPCIIGTKIATKVLKDGDLVEVDANKGIVRILKRK